jgi:hypothetical protein
MAARRVCCRSSGRWTLKVKEARDDAGLKCGKKRTGRRRRTLHRERLFGDFGINRGKEILIGPTKPLYERVIVKAESKSST